MAWIDERFCNSVTYNTLNVYGAICKMVLTITSDVLKCLNFQLVDFIDGDNLI